MGRIAEGRMPTNEIPDETVGRISAYIDYLERLAEENVATVSSQELASAAGVNAAQVRKDFSFLVPYRLGYFGTPGVGYEVRRLLFHLTRFIGLTRERSVILVGYGKLGAALARYRGFSARNFHIVAAFDVDPAKVGRQVDGIPVYHLDRLAEIVPQMNAEIAILTTPAATAQAVANALVGAGIKAILNFAPVVLGVTEDVAVRQVDLSREMQLLAFRVNRNREEHRVGEETGRAVSGNG
ncbi:MAG: redox-sensing transcriptional repressor Rex [Chloroflexota bacterium]